MTELTDDPTRAYLDEIGRVPLLTAQDETDLATAIEAGLLAQEHLDNGTVPACGATPDELARIAQTGRAAYDRMIEANLRLVMWVAKRYQRAAGMPLLDLAQEGNVGLFRAVQRFDCRRGGKFSTFAVYTIRASISRAIEAKGRDVRLPHAVVEAITRARTVRAELVVELGREPSDAEVCRRAGMTRAELDEADRALRDPVRLDAALDGDGGAATLGSLIPDPRAEAMFERAERGADTESGRSALAAAMRGLPDREIEVVALRFGLHDGDPKDCKTIGAMFGISAGRVQQIETRALQRMRYHAKQLGLAATES